MKNKKIVTVSLSAMLAFSIFSIDTTATHAEKRGIISSVADGVVTGVVGGVVGGLIHRSIVTHPQQTQPPAPPPQQAPPQQAPPPGQTQPQQTPPPQQPQDSEKQQSNSKVTPGYEGLMINNFNSKNISVKNDTFASDAVSQKYATVILNNIAFDDLDITKPFFKSYTEKIKPVLTNKGADLSIILDVQSYYDNYANDDQASQFQEKLVSLQQNYPQANFMFNLDKISAGKRLNVLKEINPKSIYSFTLNGELAGSQKANMKDILNATIKKNEFSGYFQVNLTDKTVADAIKSLDQLKTVIKEICGELDTQAKDGTNVDEVTKKVTQRIGFSLSPEFKLAENDLKVMQEYLKKDGSPNIGSAFIDEKIESPFHKITSR